MDLTKPTIHLNGTSRDVLRDQYEVAWIAVDEAIDQLKLTAPNGRDYYAQSDGAIVAATHEHNGRMAWLMRVRDELDELIGHVSRS